MKTFTIIKSLLIVCLVSLILGGKSAWAQDPVTLASFKNNLSSTEWTTTAVSSGKNASLYYKLFKDKYVQSPTIDLTEVANISFIIQARSFGTVTEAQKTITIQVVPTDVNKTPFVVGTIIPESGAKKTYTTTFENPYKGLGSIRFIALNSTTSVGAGIYSAIINEAGTFSITSAGYATYFTDKAFTMPKGVTGYIITDANGGSLTIEDKYPAGSVVPASTALLLKGAEKEYTYNVVTTTETAPTNNLLHGSISEDLISVNENTDDYLFYKLSYNEAGDQIGFYWAEDKGAYFVTEGGKAYLAVPKSQGASQMKGFALDGTTTSIQQASTATATASSIFDINGRRVSTLNGAAKGVYIVGGKKVMVK